jgi:molybdopterin-biosynthesis enzyme MoeA-like protein
VCARLQVELGDQFAAKYGTAAACATQIAAKAAPLAAAATTKCRSAADQEACITAEINASIDALSTQLGAGPTLDDITDNVAAQACARLKTELGASFARTYGTVAACTAKVKAAAAPFAAAALARCAKATGAAQAACIRTAVTESTAELQAAIGGGPTADELGDQVAAQACARIKAKYPTAAACTAAVKAAAAPDLKAALAACAKSTNTAACSETAAREIAARLTTQLAGPTVDDVTAEVVEQACARIKASLDAQEFAARFRDARGCAAAILKDAAAAATRAVAACKAAPDREACIERSVSTLTATLTAQFAGKTLDATDLAARLATQACAAVQAKVSAGDFAKAFGGSTGCRQRVAGDATAAAADTVQRCSSVTPGGRPACAEAQLRSAATAIEARLRATIKVLPSQIDTVTTQLLDQICQAAAAELGRLLDGGIPGCKARAAGDARAAAYAAFDECNGAEACVRQSLASRAEMLRKRLFPVSADPSLDMLTFEIARNACAPVYDAVVNKQRRESDWVRVFRSDRLSACTTWSDAIARTKASAVQKTCSSVRPADRRKTCFESQVPAASRSLEPTLVQATAALKKAAPARR